MQKVQIYATAACPFCRQAEALLTAHGVRAIEKVRVDLYPDQLELMQQRTGRRTVPQVFIGGTHLGGYDDLVRLKEAGRLETLLDSPQEE